MSNSLWAVARRQSIDCIKSSVTPSWKACFAILGSHIRTHLRSMGFIKLIEASKWSACFGATTSCFWICLSNTSMWSGVTSLRCPWQPKFNFLPGWSSLIWNLRSPRCLISVGICSKTLFPPHLRCSIPSCHYLWIALKTVYGLWLCGILFLLMDCPQPEVLSITCTTWSLEPL